ncbi:MAG: tetratricopeptide repeat protein [Phycisphaerales bacterium]|nr:tetratricopeptide repeat protein [Phycisphaerales bacterium]
MQAGRLDEAAKLIEKHAHAGQDRADWYVASGFLAEARGEREAALGAYERGLTLAPDDPAVFFRAARVYDLCGEDAKALQLYDRLTRRPRTHINALLNAAVIYEDLGRYEEAVHCLRRVIRAYPNHTRARLYLKDVESCIEMVIDDAVERRDDVRTRLLDTPLSEFELSVRARNCLKKMNIRTVAELVQHSEAELLAYKNFGETSLTEIKALLTKKGLRLGQQPDEVISPDLVPEPEPEPVVPLPPGQAAVLQKPVSELELSVRARRCLQRLNIQTLGDLVTFSEQELLATRNFGVTSLNEIRARIADFGLDLATKRPE